MKFNVWRIHNLIVAEAYDITEEDIYEMEYESLRWDDYYASANGLMFLDAGHFEITDNSVYYPIYSTENKMTSNRYNVVTERGMEDKFEKVINTLKKLSNTVNILLDEPITREKDKLVETLLVHNINGYQFATIKYNTNTEDSDIEDSFDSDNIMCTSDLILAYEDRLRVPGIYNSINKADLAVVKDESGKFTKEMYDKSLELFLDLKAL